MDENTLQQNNKNRILYIDLIRAYAILMMVQGHTIDLTIDPVFRDPSNIIYFIWDFLRGTTAPIFFFSSGTIFSYLFRRAAVKNEALTRMKKGVKRGATLILLGYLIVFRPEAWFSIPLNWVEYPYQFAVSVLQCIGFGLLFLSIILYMLKNVHQYINIGILILLASCFFLFYPDIESSEWVANLVLPIKAYFYLTKGTFFPLVPWLGYMFYGAALGLVLHTKEGVHKSRYFIIGFLTTGLIGHFFNNEIFTFLYSIISWDNIQFLTEVDNLYYRLSHVLIFVGIFSIISYAEKYIPKLVYLIGRNTLLIYIAQSLILYSLTRYLGFYNDICACLSPYQAILAALLVELIIVGFVILIERLNKKYGKTIIKLK